MFHRSVRRSLAHVAVLGNALPRRCGLATYTTHSVAALKETFPQIRVDHYAMDDGHGDVYGPDVAASIPADDHSAYVRAAVRIERSGAQLLWIHHEFGIYGGAEGDHLLALLRNVEMPIVATLHTVLQSPNADQRRVMLALVARADRLIVMAQHAARILETVYDVAPDRIAVIPHGAPDRPFSPTLPFKQKLGLGDGPIMLTFGLLSRGKGIETALQSLPAVVEAHPDLRYLIVGATHPTLVRDQGEQYRENLFAQVASLGLDEQVQFIDRFLGDEELLDYLQASDIYLTPYLNRGQVTSGTLSYALAMGRPVISTPYIHAEEALQGGVGTLVPFSDSGAIAAAICDLLKDPDRLAAQSRRVWEAARPTIWNENARSVMTEFSEAMADAPVALTDRCAASPRNHYVLLAGLAAMTDDVGIIQHSVHGVPNRAHGYCIDDNARALMLVSETRAGDPAERLRLCRIYAAFVQHGWNPDGHHFRNFMGYDRQWLETQGSEDSNGRTLWALGKVIHSAPQDWLRQWAAGLFNEALPLVNQLTAPRATAFAMLGAAAVLEREPGHMACRDFLARSTKLFAALLDRAQRPSWPWFEIVLAYDNARLPQAVIEAGRLLGDRDAVERGLATLRWLIGMQRAPDGHFRPVGSDSFHRPYSQPLPFDQQPLEAAATVDACLSAYRADANRDWIDAAMEAMDWFEGENDLSTSLICEGGTLCYDGLTPQGANLNLGAESILALQSARQALSELTGIYEGRPQLAVAQ